MSIEQSIAIPEKHKWCSRCSETKALSDFHKNARSSDGHTHRCKECAKAIARAWHNEHRAQAAKNKRLKRISHHAGAIIQIASKPCSKCKVTKPASEFYNDRGRHDGLAHKCKVCSKAHAVAYQARNRTAIVHKMRLRYWGMRDQICLIRRQERAANPDKFREYEKQQYWSNPERERATRKANYYRNRDVRLATNHTPEAKAKAREYRTLHRLKYAASAHRRLARKRRLPDRFTETDMRFALHYWKHGCAVCHTKFGLIAKVWWDHWIPLANPACTGTIPSNMVPLCEECNNTKKARDAAEWLQWKLGSKATGVLEAIGLFFYTAIQPRGTMEK